MERIRLACQSITFGERQKQPIEEVVPAVSAAGYEGWEVGFRHIRQTPADKLAEALDEAGLELVAVHTGSELKDADPGGPCAVQYILDYLEPLGTDRIVYSGLEREDEDTFLRHFEALNRCAAQCAEQGVHVLYHNHAHEFEDDAFIMRTILEDGAPELKLCPDIGWVHRAGADVMEFLKEAKDRLGALHFKDFADMDTDPHIVRLGEGEVPLREAAEWTRENAPGLWVMAEQDTPDGSPEEAVRANARFLRQVFPA
jgi:sugar phosphate isomerase/epimerase